MVSARWIDDDATFLRQDYEAVVEMGGDHTGSSEGRATETSVRGFWKAYRSHMKI